MSTDPLKTLLLPFETGRINLPAGDILFLNGHKHEALKGNVIIQQYFKPFTDGAVPEIPDKIFDLVLLLAGKQQQETQYFMARALDCLKEGGALVCAASNDAGGKRLKNYFKDIGLEPDGLSKHKSRVVWAKTKGEKKPDWIKSGDRQFVLDKKFISQPGVFGWNKIDSGSALLTKYLPDNLSGKGGDFGCGYGYLSDFILERNKKITDIYCLDADFRAVESCRINLERFSDININCLWTDLTRPQKALPHLDWVVMNPPFHEGRKTQYLLGAEFIKTASAALKTGGNLFMVANSHLPYEKMLETKFSHFEKITEEQGFKVFHAKK